MKLLGKRILIKKPVTKKEKSVIELSVETEQAIDKELLLKYTKLEVAEVGDECIKIKKGDIVYIGSALENAELIDIDDSFFFIINEMQVSIIW